MLRVIFAICLASSTRAKYNQSRDSSKDNVRNHLTRGDFSNADLMKLKPLFDLVSNSEEFQPLKISVGTMGTNPDLSGSISKFFERKLITSYQIQLKDDSFSKTANPLDITWIILVQDCQILNYYCKSSKPLWNSRNRYIILFVRENCKHLESGCQHSVDNPQYSEGITKNLDRSSKHADSENFRQNYNEYLESIFSALWKRDGISKILIGSLEDNFNNFYRYLPFETTSRGFGKMEKISIDQDNVEIFLKDAKKRMAESRSLTELKTRTFRTLGLFEDFKDLNKYPINVTIFKSQMTNIEKMGNLTIYSGLDTKAMFLVRDILNADFRIEVPTHRNDPFENGLKRITSGEADLIMTTYFVKSYDPFRLFEFTVGVHLDKVCLFGKAAGKVPKSFMPFLPISLDFWPFFIIYNILISFFWIKFKSFSDKVLNFEDPKTSPDIQDSKSKAAFNPIQSSLTYLAENSLNTQISSSKNKQILPFGKLSSSDNIGLASSENVQIPLSKNSPIFLPRNAQISSLGSSLAVNFGPTLVDNLESCFKKTSSENNRQVYLPEIDSRLVTCGETVLLTCSHLDGAKTTPQRIFLIGTFFFTIIVVGLYESTLLSAMRKPFEYSELHTMADVLDSNLPIWTKYDNLKDNTFYDSRLKNRVVVVRNVVPLKKLVLDKKVLGIMRLSTADLENRLEYYDENEEYLLHVIEECPAQYSLSYVVKQFSPYLERIDKILLRMSEAGLFQKWYNDMQFPIFKAEQRKLASRCLISVLTLEHYSLTFFILLIAFLCSTLVFIAEIQFARSARFRKCNGTTRVKEFQVQVE